MSTLLSASPSLMDIDHTTSDHSDAPSKSFVSSSQSHSNSHVNNGRHDISRPIIQSLPPRPSAPEPPSPPPSTSTSFGVNASSPNGLRDSADSEGSSPQQLLNLQKNVSTSSLKLEEEPVKSEPDGDGSGFSQVSDPEEDPDLGSGESDGDWSQEEYEADIRRVKVYELVGQKWTDRGTAFCQGDYDDEARQARLIARAEHSNEILLQCIIRATDVYQRQQDTLIVWTEPDGSDYALSFQDIDGCSEVWEFIGEVQRHLQEKGEDEGAPSDAGSSMHMFTAEPTNSFVHSAKLPTPALGNMHECERVIRQVCRQPHGKERLCDYIILNDYVKQISDIHQQAEDLEDIHELHACYSCMQAILLINEPALYEYILQDAIFSGVLGVLEYDPEFPTHKALYREFFNSSAHFREPIPIRDSQIRIKIHQTYRLQLLKDFILARVTDDATFNVLNSCIIFNQIDIVTNVQQDERFLRELVGLFLTTEKGDVKDGKRLDKGKARSGSFDAAVENKESRPNGSAQNGISPYSPEIGPQPAPEWLPSPSSSAPLSLSSTTPPYSLDDRRKDTIHLIQQLCLLGKNVQLPARMQLFRTLVDRGVLHAIQWALGRSEPQVLSTAGEVLSLILDHDVGGVRQHVMKQVGMAGKPTMGVSMGVAGDSTAGLETKRETLLETLCRSLTTTQEVAYRSQIADAIKTVLDVPQADGQEPTNVIAMRAMARAKDDPVTERFLDHFYQKCSENLFRPFTDLHEHHKVKAALRFFRATLKLANPNLFMQLMRHEVFTPILQLTIRESRLDNLLSSCCQEFFEHIRRENFRDLLTHLMTKYQANIKELAASPICGERFQNLIRRWEMNNEPPPKETGERPPPPVPSVRKWGQGNSLEAEEEDYFNKSDEEELPPKTANPPVISPSVNTLKRKRGKGFPGPLSTSPKQLRPLARPPMQSLVDYGDDDEDDITNAASSSKNSGSSVNLDQSKTMYSSSSFKPVDWFSGLQMPSPVTSSSPNKTSSSKKSSFDSLDEIGVDIGEFVPNRLAETRSPPRIGEKRRRETEDDEDEMLERLMKSKKQNLASSPQKDDPTSKSSVISKMSSTPPLSGSGKLKLKLGLTTNFSLTPNSQSSSSPSPSPTSSNDETPKKNVDS
ncbi:hypothetical protein Clacol_001453 [Clathrus columnatus]|uniref:Serine/threonine-protein phosphatase 4 regulatory subunit 3-like central domain-containing protein n=1 Tax=Clathrus columnatus TaxID=1419009 RepID=A0AAV5A207_9AGAM|nr:hypothetical protein Clacol_001453 [Clathrus columnatus]